MCQMLALRAPLRVQSHPLEQRQGRSAPPEDEGVDPVDPEFLAALPEELQQEVLESRRRGHPAAQECQGAGRSTAGEIILT